MITHRGQQTVSRSVGRRSLNPRDKDGDQPGRTFVSNTDLLSDTDQASLLHSDAGQLSRPVSLSEASTSGAEPNGTAGARRRAGLSGMVLAELRELAGQLGISSTTGMRKSDLITAIKQRQNQPSQN